MSNFRGHTLLHPVIKVSTPWHSTYKLVSATGNQGIHQILYCENTAMGLLRKHAASTEAMSCQSAHGPRLINSTMFNTPATSPIPFTSSLASTYRPNHPIIHQINQWPLLDMGLFFLSLFLITNFCSSGFYQSVSRVCLCGDVPWCFFLWVLRNKLKLNNIK